jgi:hypothetical protein
MRAPSCDQAPSKMSSTRRHRRALSAVLAALVFTFAVGNATGQEPAQAPPIVAQRAAPKQHARTSRGNAWAPFALMGIAVALGVAASLVFLSSKKRGVQRSRAKPKQRNVSAPAETSVFIPPVVDPAAICDKARSQLNARMPAPEPSREILPPDPNLDTAISTGFQKASLPPADYGLTLPATLGPLSRGATIACGRCKRLIPAELGTPPWCPHCGADLKSTDDNAASAFSGVTAGNARELQPPYFVGRLGRTYRVYILPTKLLFLDAPALDEHSGAERIVRSISIQAGLVGWLIGSAVAGTIGDDRRSKARNRHTLLDLAEVPALVEMADREYTSFRIDVVGDLGATRIEGLTFWQNAFADRCAAQLHFVHPERGPVIVELPKADEVRVAIKQLAAVLGDKLTVNAVWDWSKQRFVPKG